MALAALIALVFDACIDPLIGQFSDNLRTRWGRRHPFMYAAAAAVGARLPGAVEPAALDGRALFYYLLVTAIVIRTLSSLFEVPSSALAAEFSTGYEQRSVLLTYRFFFGWVGGLTVNFLAFAVLPDAGRHAQRRPAQPGRLRPLRHGRRRRSSSSPSWSRPSARTGTSRT